MVKLIMNVNLKLSKEQEKKIFDRLQKMMDTILKGKLANDDGIKRIVKLAANKYIKESKFKYEIKSAIKELVSEIANETNPYKYPNRWKSYIRNAIDKEVKTIVNKRIDEIINKV